MEEIFYSSYDTMEELRVANGGNWQRRDLYFGYMKSHTKMDGGASLILQDFQLTKWVDGRTEGISMSPLCSMMWDNQLQVYIH